MKARIAFENKKDLTGIELNDMALYVKMPILSGFKRIKLNKKILWSFR